MSDEATLRARLIALDPEKIHGAMSVARELGLGRADIPELVAIARAHPTTWDDEAVRSGLASLASLVLVELGEPVGVTAMLEALDDLDDDELEAYSYELPDLAERLGLAVLEPIAAYVADGSHGDQPRLVASEALDRLVDLDEAAESRAVLAYVDVLRAADPNARVTNASAVSALGRAGAVVHLDLIRGAFAAGIVDETMARWGHVAWDLGIGPKPRGLLAAQREAANVNAAKKRKKAARKREKAARKKGRR